MAEQNLVGIGVTPETYDRLRTAAQLRQRSVPEVLQDLLEEHESMRAETMKSMERALQQSQRQALLDGTSEMTMEEIVEEIAVARGDRLQMAKTG